MKSSKIHIFHMTPWNNLKKKKNIFLSISPIFFIISSKTSPISYNVFFKWEILNKMQTIELFWLCSPSGIEPQDITLQYHYQAWIALSAKFKKWKNENYLKRFSESTASNSRRKCKSSQGFPLPSIFNTQLQRKNEIGAECTLQMHTVQGPQLTTSHGRSQVNKF